MVAPKNSPPEPTAGIRIYRDLTMQEDHRLMKSRDDMTAVIEGLHSKHVLLAAFLKATEKIDWRALQRRTAIGEMPEPLNMEAHQPTPIVPASDDAPFAFRRANLVRASE
jgi:hypothetical protein